MSKNIKFIPNKIICESEGNVNKNMIKKNDSIDKLLEETLLNLLIQLLKKTIN